MRLYEHEAKEALALHGVRIPSGVVARTPEVPSGYPLPAMLKAQVLSGGRGKAGGVIAADSQEAVLEGVRRLQSLSLAGQPVDAVLVEERLDIRQELYLALLLDRSTGWPTFLVSRRGGVDVEDHGDQQLTKVGVHPLIGLMPYHVRAIQRVLGLGQEFYKELQGLLNGVWTMFLARQAMLVEINPLAQVTGDRLVAADAKIVIDSRVAKQSPDYAGERDARTSIEVEAAEMNAVGVDLRGDVAVVAAGAGVLMASADSIAARGASLGLLLDLGGFPRSQREEARLFALAKRRRPKVVFFNFFMQVMSCEQYARAIVETFSGPGDLVPVARMKGHHAAEGRAVLASVGIASAEAYDAACDLVLQAHGARLSGQDGS